jgi:hypothetical protein
MRTILCGVCLVFSLASAAQAQESHSRAASKPVVVDFKNTEGQSVGSAQLTSTPKGVRICRQANTPSTFIKFQHVTRPILKPQALTSIQAALNITTMAPQLVTSRIFHSSSARTVRRTFP